MSFVKELKRRNVIRVAIAYAVATWLLIEVSATTFPMLRLPEWTATFVAVLLMIGFPVALIFAWAYELTPEGLKKEKDVDRSQSVTHITGRKLDFMIITVLVLALSYFAFDKFVLDPQRDAALLESATQQDSDLTPGPVQAEKPVEPAEQSIAVLAFVNMSDDSSNEYFSDGLSEELLNLLVKIPELRVAARTSSFSYKGKDVKIAQIGKELNVTHVLEGSVRKAGNHVRITAQLVKADDGFHLWSETFDRTLDDIFVIQDDIASAVVDALRVKLLDAMPTKEITDPEVYALYLQGLYFDNLKGKENWEKAVSAFKQALAIDPEYAPAWVGISRTYSYQTRARLRSREKGSALSLEAVERALAIDSNLASAWASLAWFKKYYEWDWEGATAALDKAVQLEPNNAQVLGVAASLAGNLGQTSASTVLHEPLAGLIF
jgi:TolB-like protein